MRYPHIVIINEFAVGNVTVKRQAHSIGIAVAKGLFSVFDQDKFRRGPYIASGTSTYYIGADVPGGEVYEFVGMEYQGTATLPDKDLEPKLRELLKKFDGCMVAALHGDVYLRKGNAETRLGCRDVLRFIVPFSRVLYHSSDEHNYLIEYDESVVLPKHNSTARWP
jgi:hypothetical protein